MMDEERETIVLIDEEGEEEEFVFLDIIEMDENKYVILSPAQPAYALDEEADYDEDLDEEEEDEVVILKVVEDNGEETYATIEDEDELDRVFEVFMSGFEEEEMEPDE
jgi:uncharacterized protein YrzB (UPF0473 family)